MENELSFILAVRLFKGEKAFGPGIATLLRTVERTGSLQKAAEAMEMAYSKAWKMIKETERLWGVPLTYRDIGGKNGGGSVLTPESRLILEHYESFTEEIQKTSSEVFGKYYNEEFFRELEAIQPDSHKGKF